MIPAYIETLFGCWWAGLVAVPVNAKLHPKELAYVLANCGARWAFVDAAWHAAIGGGDGGIALDRVVEFGAAEYAGCSRSSPPSEPGIVRCRRSRVALLHERHDRAAEGRRDLARQPARDEPMLPRLRRSGRAGRRAAASGAAVARLGAVRAAARGSGRRQRRAGIGRLRRRRDLPAARRVGPRVLLRRADDGEAPRRRRPRSGTRGSTG